MSEEVLLVFNIIYGRNVIILLNIVLLLYIVIEEDIFKEQHFLIISFCEHHVS